MPRVAAIDCGTNSIRLLVADVTVREDGSQWLRDVHREMRVNRLGQGVDATGRLAPESLARTKEALYAYGEMLRRTSTTHGPALRHLRHARRGEPRGVLRDGPRHPGDRRRGDHRRRRGPAVLRRRRRRPRSRRGPLRGRRRRRRVDRARHRHLGRRARRRRGGLLVERGLRPAHREDPARRPPGPRPDPRGRGVHPRHPRRRLRRGRGRPGPDLGGRRRDRHDDRRGRAWACAPTTPTASTSPGSGSTRSARPAGAWSPCPARSARSSARCTPAGSTSSAPAPW